MTFFLTTVLRSQMIVISIVSVLIIVSRFMFRDVLYGVFDIMGTGIPMLYSGFTGFGNGALIVCQRGVYLLAGLGFVFLTVVVFRRLPQKISLNILAFLLAAACFGGAGMLADVYLSRSGYGPELRSRMILLNKQYEDEAFVTVTGCDLTVKHLGGEIEVVADITFKNVGDVPLSRYIFSLNPGLEVTGVTVAGEAVDFDRTLHILAVRPRDRLLPGETDSLVFFYRGSIDDEACYIDIDESVRAVKNNLFRYIIDKRFSFVTPRYVLLTHENYWYPKAGIPHGPDPLKPEKKDFVRFTLDVSTDSTLTAISQGVCRRSGAYRFVFEPEQPLPQISLVIGDYEHKSITIDGIEYSIWNKRGHDFFTPVFKDLKAKHITELIRENKDEFESRLKRDYPFTRFSLVEVPIQFLAFQRVWDLSPETVQPEQVFMPEKVGPPFHDFAFSYRAVMNFPFRFEKTPVNVELFVLRGFIPRDFLRVSAQRERLRFREKVLRKKSLSLMRYQLSGLPPFEYNMNIFPNYYCFTNQIESDNNLFELVIKHYLRSKLYHNQYHDHGSHLIYYEIANNELVDKSLKEILEQPEHHGIAYEVLVRKSEELFGLMEYNAGITTEDLDEFLNAFLDNTAFSSVNDAVFENNLKDSFGIGLRPNIESWYTVDTIPQFSFHDQHCYRGITDGKTVHYVTFKVHNSEPIGGVFGYNIYFREGSSEQHQLFLKGHQMKEIWMKTGSEPPRGVTINSIISRNDIFFGFRINNIQKLSKNMEFQKEKVVTDPFMYVDKAVTVDNLDDGCAAIDNEKKTIVRKLLHTDTGKPEFMRFDLHNPPRRWHMSRDMTFSGSLQKSVYFKRTGKGLQKIRFTADIPEAGTYDVLFFMPPKYRLTPPGPRSMGRRRIAVKDFHFSIDTSEGVETIVSDVSDCDSGWLSLGRFHFNTGKASVELSDLSDGKIVFADAVRWKKVEDDGGK